MGNKLPLTELRRAQIIILHGEEHTEMDIAAKFHWSKTAIHNDIIKSNADGTFHDKTKQKSLGVNGRLHPAKTSQ